MLIFWPAPKPAEPLGQGGYMLSQIPVDFAKVKKENRNQVILRAAIIAELDAINLYVQMAAQTDDADIQKVLLDIAREEKTHVGEFETMLLRFDTEQVTEHEHAKKEIKELTGK
jgi:rubrerythrin